MARWTVSVGQDDIIVVERTGDGTWVIDIPSKRPVIADRAAVEDLRLKLGAAISDSGETR
jgi:hypothetical protein